MIFSKISILVASSLFWKIEIPSNDSVAFSCQPPRESRFDKLFGHRILKHAADRAHHSPLNNQPY